MPTDTNTAACRILNIAIGLPVPIAVMALLVSRFHGSVTNNNGFWIGRLDLLTLLLQLHFQLQSLITAHNRRLRKARSVLLVDYERLSLHCGWLINSRGDLFTLSLTGSLSLPRMHSTLLVSSGLLLHPRENRTGITHSKDFTTRTCGKRVLNCRCHGHASTSTKYTACVA
jgi:hypothetical protein